MASLLPIPREPEWSTTHTRSSLVERDLDEMIAGAERTHGIGPSRVNAAIAGRLGLSEQVLTRSSARAFEVAVKRSSAQRNSAFNAGPQGFEIIGQLVCGEFGAHGDHAAADVHADGGRNNRAGGGDDAAYGCAFSEVAVRHHCDVPENEWHCSDIRQLFFGFRFNGGRICPRNYLVSNSVHAGYGGLICSACSIQIVSLFKFNHCFRSRRYSRSAGF